MDHTINHEDGRIAAALASGDEATWKAVYDEHAAVVYRVALATARSPEVAHDVTQDVFAHLWRHPDRFDPARGSLRAYLITRTRSRTLDVLRSETSRSRRERTEGRAAIIDSADIADAVADRDTADRLRAALATLRDDERSVIELAYFGGRSYREVATALGIPEGTAKSRIRSGLTRLRLELEAL
jgi:RNA polymerase sigma-70 factor (ECF subfamily)